MRRYKLKISGLGQNAIANMGNKCLAKKNTPTKHKTQRHLSVLFRLDIKYKIQLPFQTNTICSNITADNKFLSCMCLTVFGASICLIHVVS